MSPPVMVPGLTRHIVHQGPVLAALARTAFGAIVRSGRGAPLQATPGAELHATLPPRPASLVRDYVRHVGGDPDAYRRTVPPHLFPQWSFPLAAATLRGLPYPMVKVVNAGCRLEMRAPLPAGEPLVVSARLESVDDDGRRALLHTRVVTGTASAPGVLVAHLFAYVPLGGGAPASSGEAPKGARVRVRVPDDARELAFWRIGAGAGRDFAALTGDVNPLHWLPPYARALGFRSTILHGFSTLARAMEGLHRRLFSGDVTALAAIDVRFTRPLLLPGRAGLYVTASDDVYVGDAPGGGTFLEGRFTRRASTSSDRSLS
jgi:acyl dehydratase